ncbi:hypothetical protein YC2023_111023 [Brassica napus]
MEWKHACVDAEGNNLQGHLPLNLTTYGNLKDINLRSNMFSGDIPKKRISKQIRGSAKEYKRPIRNAEEELGVEIIILYDQSSCPCLVLIMLEM